MQAMFGAPAPAGAMDPRDALAPMPAPYEVLGPAPPGQQCAFCDNGFGAKRIRHGGDRVSIMHPGCADRRLAAWAADATVSLHAGPDAPPAEPNAPQATSMPFMLTQGMKRRLRIYGYSDTEIGTVSVPVLIEGAKINDPHARAKPND